jgi:hypothetical protein
MVTLQIELGEKQFEFSSYVQWVNKAQGWFANRGLKTGDTLSIDTQGRICRIGKDMMRARDENTFPISVYLIND